MSIEIKTTADGKVLQFGSIVAPKGHFLLPAGTELINTDLRLSNLNNKWYPFHGNKIVVLAKQYTYARKLKEANICSCPDCPMNVTHYEGEAPSCKPDPYAELKAAHAQGKTLQINEGRLWGCSDRWEDWTKATSPLFGNPPEFYRVKPDPVPLCKDDIPPNSVFRNTTTMPGLAWLGISKCNIKGVTFADCKTDYVYTYEELRKRGWEILRPGQDWQPCHKDAP